MRQETTPLPNIHERPTSMVVALSRLAIVLTVLFWIAYVVTTILRQFYEGPQNYRFALEAYGYLIVVTFLTFSSLMYLVARQGAIQRFSKHVRVARAVLDKHFSARQSSITVLIPSYNEETSVIRKTLLSAALQEFPNIRIVLLIDDDSASGDSQSNARLTATRQLGDDIKHLFSIPYRRFSQAVIRFENRNKKISIPPKVVKDLAMHYAWAATWLHDLAEKEHIEDHVDVFFADQVLGELSRELKHVSEALISSLADGVILSGTRIEELYRRLTWIFGIEIETFERKKYASLSHDSSKAMNLNAYIGLMGGMYREELTPEGPILISTKKKRESALYVPDSEFILTLDADSILLRDYCLRLVYFLQQPDNVDVAVTQTPYSSFRGATSRIERLSGATTDIQHILHQGMSQYGATFWVGANAVIRKKALEDIVEKEWVGGFEIKRYIQDRTVIEDTDSSIDLAIHGWRLVNYPERLSYSATPPDFGSLVIQRRRWANGGLLILPKLWEEICMRRHHLKKISQVGIMLRLNYMASIAWSNLGLIFLLVYPYDGRLLSPFVLLAALPYFAAMAYDLKRCRYSYSDVIRIYGFNLILLPVNLAGVFKSLQQALTGKKIPFARTPKIKNRTVVGLPYVLAPLFIVGFSIVTLHRNIEIANWVNAGLAGFNALAASYAIVWYIGIKNVFVDIWVGLTNMLYVTEKQRNQKETLSPQSVMDWKVVLYHGDDHGVLPHNSVSELFIKHTQGNGN